MRPLPTTPENLSKSRPSSTETKPGRSLELGPPPSTSNHRRSSSPTQRVYPWLLGVSTLMAAAFCVLYISKPVIVTAAAFPDATSATSPPLAANNSKPRSEALSLNALPGDESSRPRAMEPQNLAQNADTNEFEQTNLKIQHVLGARGPDDEDLGQLTLEIPVLYQSGVLRWTQDDVEKSRSLLSRIRSYQEKSRTLREEAVVLISEWDELMISSVPDAALRADSPTLPENQGPGTAGAAALNSTEVIEIEQ